MTEREQLIETDVARTPNLLTDTRGAGMVEYIILVGLIALAAIAGFETFGDAVNGKAEEMGGAIDGMQVNTPSN